MMVEVVMDVEVVVVVVIMTAVDVDVATVEIMPAAGSLVVCFLRVG